jgi:hypothetical protein
MTTEAILEDLFTPEGLVCTQLDSATLAAPITLDELIQAYEHLREDVFKSLHPHAVDFWQQVQVDMHKVMYKEFCEHCGGRGYRLYVERDGTQVQEPCTHDPSA